MKYLKQFGVILLITFLGEILKNIIPLAIPASIYGLVLMLIALQTKLITLEHIQDVGVFLIEIMPIMFIPAAVGLMDSWEILKPICVPIIVITVVTTIIVMVVTGRITQLVINMEKREQDE
ncbi:CidA/LrgA family protein [Aminipila sp.]|uniref:CidA/LrgA family protein n=1 Tax=Aminipila sp. TaxID=2060095 RepID=UPI002898254B|nr:CidA/LrgA family protein [Aminipila sp.]